jgi:pentatricopeptide repeat protein
MVIDAFCKNSDVKTGFKLLKEMQNKGRKPGVVTYNVVMNGLCRLGQMKNADMLLNAMLNIGVPPDDITYNILLDGHCKYGKVRDAEELKSAKGMVSDFGAYTSLINEVLKKKPSKSYHDNR